MRYRSNETNFRPTLVVVAVGLVFGLLILAITEIGSAITVMAAIAPIGFVIGLFSGMTINIGDDDMMDIAYRFGAFRRRVRLSDVESVEKTDTGRWDGFGLKIGDELTSYMATPGPAVVLHFATGTPLRIGTPDPDGLIAAIRRSRPKIGGEAP